MQIPQTVLSPGVDLEATILYFRALFTLPRSVGPQTPQGACSVAVPSPQAHFPISALHPSPCLEVGC